ncbi:24312_t:CDS:1 [Dentiscutata erythropus]|uniref:24312_t:CDS:1 n=1 Tax=Dentiscutata erythropus TaxID=1348616 RepID=A0A9N9NFF4_9GLOM|nr:24312_t:CDS:1 [Dentiscutata erythropus]
MNVSDRMTALEWTTLSKLTERNIFNFYGAAGQPVLTGIKLWNVGTHRRNVAYILIGICLLALFGVSVIAPLGIQTCTVMYNLTSVETNVVNPDILSRAVNNTFTPNQLSQIRICGLFARLPCPGMIDGDHVNSSYAEDFNKTYSHTAMRYRLLQTSGVDNITFPVYDFMMGEVTSAQTEYGIVDTMVVDHDNGGFLASHTIQPKQEVGKRYNWSIKGLWLQPYASCKSTNITRITWQNGTFSWVDKFIINKDDAQPPQLYPLGDEGQNVDLLSRSIRYSLIIQFIARQQLNMTVNGTFIESNVFNDVEVVIDPKSINTGNLPLNVTTSNVTEASILCAGFGGQDTIRDKIVGVHCWTVFGPPNITERGIEQALYGCAAAVKASVEIINVQSNSTGDINVLGKQTVPMNWYIENASLNITDMDLWWGGVEPGENIPNNSMIVSQDSLWLPAGSSFLLGSTGDAQSAGVAGIASYIMANSLNSQYISGYRADGVGNLALLQQWKDQGTTEEGMGSMFQRQMTDILVNMVTPTGQATISGPIQVMIEKTCYDILFGVQYCITMILLIMLLCLLFASTINGENAKSLSIKQIVRQMDLGRAILNTLDYSEASAANASDWEKIDGLKFISLSNKGFKKFD